MSADHVHFVFSTPPEQISQEQYDEFYETHLDEILVAEGFTAGRRYWLEPASSERPNFEFRHLVIYRIEGEPAEAHAAVGKLYEAGKMTTPEWFGGAQWLTYDARPLDDDNLEFPDEAYVVLGNANDSTSASENLPSDGFEKVWSYELTTGMITVEDPIAGGATQGAVYPASGGVEAPALPEGEFFSYHCRAASPAR